MKSFRACGISVHADGTHEADNEDPFADIEEDEDEPEENEIARTSNVRPSYLLYFVLCLCMITS